MIVMKMAQQQSPLILPPLILPPLQLVSGVGSLSHKLGVIVTTHDAMRQGKANVGFLEKGKTQTCENCRQQVVRRTHMHLLRVRSPALVGRYHSHLPDLYRAGPGLVTTCHVPICGETREGGGNGGRGGRGYNSQHSVTAPAIVRSRYSRYMLCVPERES